MSNKENVLQNRLTLKKEVITNLHVLNGGKPGGNIEEASGHTICTPNYKCSPNMICGVRE